MENLSVVELKKQCKSLNISLTKSDGTPKLKKDLIKSLSSVNQQSSIVGGKRRSRKSSSRRRRSRKSSKKSSKRRSRKISRRRRKSSKKKGSKKRRSLKQSGGTYNSTDTEFKEAQDAENAAASKLSYAKIDLKIKKATLKDHEETWNKENDNIKNNIKNIEKAYKLELNNKQEASKQIDAARDKVNSLKKELENDGENKNLKISINEAKNDLDSFLAKYNQADTKVQESKVELNEAKNQEESVEKFLKDVKSPKYPIRLQVKKLEEEVKNLTSSHEQTMRNLLSLKKSPKGKESPKGWDNPEIY